MTPGSLAAGGFPAGSHIIPSVMASLVLIGMQCKSTCINNSIVTVRLQ